mgnify:CR=1 FL=1
MKLKKYRKKRMCDCVWLILLIVIISLGISLKMIDYFSEKANEILLPMAESKVRKVVTMIINSACDEEMISDNLYVVSKNNDNELSFEEGYYDLSLNIIFTILFGIVYKWGWIHRTTKYLNNASGYEKRSPIKKTLLLNLVN